MNAWMFIRKLWHGRVTIVKAIGKNNQCDSYTLALCSTVHYNASFKNTIFDENAQTERPATQ